MRVVTFQGTGYKHTNQPSMEEAFGVVSKEPGYPGPAGGRRELTK